MPEYSEDDRPHESTRTIRTEHLRLGFHWAVDRWRHELAVRSGGGWLRVASSLELGARREDPGRVVGPAYQQFHHQAGEGRAFALLVGQAGPHHFSASFEVEDGGPTSRVRVDVADRVRVEDPRLACAYVVVRPPAVPIEGAEGGAAWDVSDAGRLSLSPAGPPGRPGRVVVGEPPLPHLPDSVRDAWGDVALTPLQIVEDPEPGAASLRCRYLWTFQTREGRSSQPL